MQGTLLDRLRSQETEIRIAIIGIGSIGKGLAYQAGITPGINPVSISDTRIERAIACAHWLGRDYRVVSTLDALEDAIRAGTLAIPQDSLLAAQSQFVDVLIEATNSIAEAGHHGVTALRHGQDLVMMNYEADLMFGPLLLEISHKENRVYTACDGDQPTAIKYLVDDITLWGFELVMAGNIKGYLDRYVNPTLIKPEADKRNLDYKMCTSYTDGTKLGIEMAVVANALNLEVAVPGMHGPRGKRIEEVFDLFDFEELWSDRKGVVDYVVGAQPSGGVFVIGYTDNEFQQYTLDWFPPKMGPGPFYLFYRPYHLGHIEAMACVAEAVLDQHARLQPTFGFKTNVYSYARKDLQEGAVLDGIGGYMTYGLIENCAANLEKPGLPICLSEGLVLKKSRKKDQKILLEEVSYDPHHPAFELHAKALAASGVTVPFEQSPR